MYRRSALRKLCFYLSNEVTEPELFKRSIFVSRQHFVVGYRFFVEIFYLFIKQAL